jgi:3D (Asp-Asp-Asp) domain-containing protein
MILTNAIITAYCVGTICANGRAPVAGLTVAAPRSIPLGTRVQIEGHWYRVDDRTNKRFDGRWDIYMTSKAKCLQYGKQYHNVTIAK